MQKKVSFRLEASSYARTPQAEPFSGVLHFARYEIVSAQLPVQRDFRAALLQETDELFDALDRNDRVDPARRHQDRLPGEVRLLVGLEYQHWAQQDRGAEYFRVCQHHRRRDVCAVRVAQRKYVPGVELVSRERRANELRQLFAARAHFGWIEHALGETAKKTRSSSFQNFPARADDRRTRSDGLGNSDQVVLVATGPVQNEQCVANARRRRAKTVYEPQITRHALGPWSSIGSWMLGSSASVSKRRGSSHEGSLSERPSESTRSSIEKPGPSVALSNNTPPGSRK